MTWTHNLPFSPQTDSSLGMLTLWIIIIFVRNIHKMSSSVNSLSPVCETCCTKIQFGFVPRKEMERLVGSLLNHHHKYERHGGPHARVWTARRAWTARAWTACACTVRLSRARACSSAGVWYINSLWARVKHSFIHLLGRFINCKGPKLSAWTSPSKSIKTVTFHFLMSEVSAECI